MIVWKYKLELTDKIQELPIPYHADILSFQMQNGILCIWVKIIRGFENETRKFRIVATGEEMGFDGDYIGTVQDGRLFVWHLFELREEND